ncbi:MAG TPA: RIP metalloprotease RseP [Kofleriaceae bacterium]|nr:RIP metalloprotease RseP [Kofleriaceae bacterium]
MSVVYFLLLLGVLVVIHELGHFIAAKALGFQVLRFSVGFGRPLVRVKGKETEYQIAVIPLGGYVRILGEEPDDEIPPALARRSFNGQPIWRRLIVVFAGPAANLILPVLIYFIVFAGHTRKQAATVGDVLADSPAAHRDIQPGDRVLAVDGKTIRYWEDLENRVRGGVGTELLFKIKRGDQIVERKVAPVLKTERQRDGSSSKGGYIGITQAPFPPLIGVIDPHSPAGIAKLQTGDRIISVDDQVVQNWTVLRKLLSRGMQARSVVFFRATPVPGVPHVRLLEARHEQVAPVPRIGPDGTEVPYTGIEPAEMFVTYVAPGTPADIAGMRPGDLVISLGDGRTQEPMHHWMEFDQRLQSRPTFAWTVEWQRWSPEQDKVVTLRAQIKQIGFSQLDEYDNIVERLVFGASSSSDRGRGELVPIRDRFTYALTNSVDRTGDTIATMVSGFWSILSGRAPRESVGGPVMMYRVASVSGRRGFESFLMMLALISVNLGLINLLPIPVLDGGHLLMFAVEAVRRRPLSLRARERIHLVGLALVGIITVLALRNDVVRYVLR